MSVRYHTRRGVEIPDYQCVRHSIQDGGPRCQTVPGGGVDAAIGQLLLDTLTPLSLEVALTVQSELEHRADEADALRRQHVQRAQEHADLARRRYLAVDPSNRLVADSLESAWNEALRALHTAQDDYDKATAAAAAALTEEHKARIRALATDFPALWSNQDTPQRERKRMVRLLVEDVTLTKTDQIHVHVRLRGGQTTSLTVPIPTKAWQTRQTHPDTLATLNQLLDDHTDGGTAALLNAAGHRSGEGKPFTARIVLDLRLSNNLPSHADRLRANGLLTKDEIAQRLGVHPTMIKNWHQAGMLNSRKANDKNERLYQPPAAGDPSLVARQGSPLRNEFPPNPRQEVHCEAKPLSLGVPHPGGVGDEAAVLRVVQPARRRLRVQRVGVGHDRRHVVRDQDLEHPAEERPRGPATGDTASRVCENVSHTNMCREYTAVKISACTLRRRPAAAS
jgi:hypothetical protein